MKPIRKIKDFRQREDGSLLIFFVISIVAILGIMALSFDMGRRASTQSDMQSFADNVALAAAGELDGQPDAITRATTAAQNAIVAANEQLKAGASGAATTLRIASTALGDPVDGLVFYSSLPANDSPGNYTVASLSATKYDLPAAGVTTDPTAAAFVGVRLSEVPVDWMFGNIFGSNLSISTDIGAVAVAGNSAFTCEVSPLMFCLPREQVPGAPAGTTRAKFLSPGQAIQLQTVGQGAAWNPGQFGFLDINWLRGNAATSPCWAELNGNGGNEARFQACLLARGIDACFNSRRVDVQTGQRSGQEAAAFNLPFGFVGQSMTNLVNRGNASLYATGPHTVSGQAYLPNGQGGGQGNICGGNPSSSPDTMPFPLDNCHASNNCADGRFGNGDWSIGRTQYVDTNYTIRDSSGAVVEPGSFFDFPDSSMTRYQYYLREIARAANGGVDQGNHNPTSTITNDSWSDYWPSAAAPGVNPIIPSAHNRFDNGLPQCDLPPSANADRRVLVAAGIDCPPGLYQGTVPGDVPVAQYYRVFLLGPARDVPNSGTGNSDPLFQIDVEVIEPVGGEAGASTLDAGIFREVIQLYK